MNTQPVLHDDLVKLRPLGSFDFAALFSIASDSLIWEQHPAKKRSTLQGFQDFFNESLASKGGLMILERKTDRPVGSSRFKIIDEEKKVVEIGWTFISREYWGGTYNRAIKRLMINHSLSEFEMVVLYIDKDNVRSQRAAEKIGAMKIPPGNFSWAPHEPSGNVTYCISTPLT